MIPNEEIMVEVVVSSDPSVASGSAGPYPRPRGVLVRTRYVVRTGMSLFVCSFLFVCFFVPFFSSTFTRRLILNSEEVWPSAIFWTSRGHKCHPFSPPVRAFTFIAHRVQHSHCSSIFIKNVQDIY